MLYTYHIEKMVTIMRKTPDYHILTCTFLHDGLSIDKTTNKSRHMKLRAAGLDAAYYAIILTNGDFVTVCSPEFFFVI